MKFSVWPSMERPWSEVHAFARFIEELDWHGLWYADHYMPNTGTSETAGGALYECVSMLAALAATTSKLRLGSLVTPTTMNHPALIANRAATIDNISNGRFVLGLGAGWQINEHEAFGIDLMDPKPRVDRFEEAIQIVSMMLSQDRTNFDGEHFTIRDAPCEPRPVQSTLPILVGTGGPRMLRIVARHAQEWNTWGPPGDTAPIVAKLNEACENEGRDPSTVHRSVQGLWFIVPNDEVAAKVRAVAPPERANIGTPSQLVDIVGAYKEQGFDEIIVPDFTLGKSEEERFDNYSKFDAEVVSHFR